MSQQERLHNSSTPPPEHAGKRPASERKILANRKNASNSTGPRSGEGKARSRMNALKHGLFARELLRDILVQREDPEEFIKMHTDLREVWQPCGRAEELEVEHIAVCWWKRLRLWRYENADMRVNLDHVAIRGHVPGPPVPLIPKDRALMLLLESAQEQIESSGEMPPEFKEKILASSPWLRELWPKLEEIAQRIVRENDEKIANRLAQEIGIRSTLAKKLLESRPGVRAARARLAAVLPTKLAIREILRSSEEQFQYVMDGAYDQQAIPNDDSLNRILRYSGMIDRELNRAFDRLERLQRRRKGEPVPPSLNLNLN